MTKTKRTGKSKRSLARPKPKPTAKTAAKSTRKGSSKSPARRRPRILADDIADKVHAEYRQFLAEGLPSRRASEQLVKRWKKELSTKPLQDQFWLALAGTQWQFGRLEPPTKKKALAIIDRLLLSKRKSRNKVEDPITAHRHQALTALRGILRSPQPPIKEIPRSKAPSSDEFAWPVGEVFAYKLRSGRHVLFHVVACLGDKSTGFWPVFALLDWIGDRPPPDAEIQELPLKTDPHLSDSQAIWMVSVLRRHPGDFVSDRVQWLHVKRPPHARNISSGFAITYWKEKLDKKLRFDFGWE